MAATTQATNEIVVTHIFDAPPELVWKAWTDPEQVMRWWGPKEFTSPACKIDLREGGSYLFCLRSPDGEDFWSTGIFTQIVPMQRLVFTDSFADAEGKVVPASHYGFDDSFPQELLVTVTFEEEAGKTRLILCDAGLPEGEIADEAQAGWEESFDKLAETLASR
jgi:uncharacterized protein YndB with AHSA1/START domain